MFVQMWQLDGEFLLILGERAVYPRRIEPLAVDGRDTDLVHRVKQIAPSVRRNRHFELTRDLPVEEVVAQIERTHTRHNESEYGQRD